MYNLFLLSKNTMQTRGQWGLMITLITDASDDVISFSRTRHYLEKLHHYLPLPGGYSPAPLYYYVGMVVEGVSSSSPLSCSPCNPLGRLVSSTSPPVPSTNSSYVDFSLKGLGPKSSIISSRPSTSFSRRRKAI